MTEDGQSWQQKRRDAADEQLAALQRRKAAETAQAADHVAAFVVAARAQGLPTARLRARAHNGRATYRTQVTGWYLKRNRTIAIGDDGGFYVLSAPTSMTARVTGVVVHPSDPPLVVGAGGRDGESMPIAELLALRLAADDGWG